jgi:hypothetical protein
MIERVCVFVHGIERMCVRETVRKEKEYESECVRERARVSHQVSMCVCVLVCVQERERGGDKASIKTKRFFARL